MESTGKVHEMAIPAVPDEGTPTANSHVQQSRLNLSQSQEHFKHPTIQASNNPDIQQLRTQQSKQRTIQEQSILSSLCNNDYCNNNHPYSPLGSTQGSCLSDPGDS